MYELAKKIHHKFKITLSYINKYVLKVAHKTAFFRFYLVILYLSKDTELEYHIRRTV